MNATAQITALRPALPGVSNVAVLSTTRQGGVSTGPFAALNLGTHVGDDPAAVAANRARVCAALPADPLWMEQVHGTAVCDADQYHEQCREQCRDQDRDQGRDRTPPVADGAVSRVPGRVLCVMTADCLPVVLGARDGSVVGIAHAGWRGLANGVIEATVSAMRASPASLVAWLGPAIGGNAYEVGQEVFDAFVAVDAAAATGFHSKGNGKYWCDLAQLARQRLRTLDVTLVTGGEHCTHADTDRFFSFRRDGRTGRMATCVWITA